MLVTKENREQLITIEYSKGFEKSFQSVKLKDYATLKLKLEKIGYNVKIVEK